MVVKKTCTLVYDTTRTGELRNLTICPCSIRVIQELAHWREPQFVDSRRRIGYSHDVSKAATYTISGIPD
jgi:hypothetical protein